MQVLIVSIKVKSDQIDAFIAATLENRESSLEEPGIFRFELLRNEADPLRFVLIEGYVDEAAQAAHKDTPHYAKWKDLVEPMMAEPRSRERYLMLGSLSGSGGKY